MRRKYLLPAIIGLLVFFVYVGDIAAQSAADITFDSSGTNLTATDVQAAIESIDSQLLGPVASFDSIELPEPIANVGWPILKWPTTLPVAASFQHALTANGSWTIVDNILCTSYNQSGRCSGSNGDPLEHAFAFNLELSFQFTTPESELIEQNFNFFAADGPEHYRPWAFHIAQTKHTSSWNVERGDLSGQAFEFNKNGNVQIGPSPGMPTRTLHVVGAALITNDLTVTSFVNVTGLVIQTTTSPSYGPLVWGDVDDVPGEVCLKAGYECLGAHELGGSSLSCDSEPAGSGFFARCGCTDSEDMDGDGLLACIDSCPSDFDPTNLDTDGDGAGNACDLDDDDDGLTDEVETNTGVYVSPTDTGSDPLNADTDGDGFGDLEEVLAGTDPNDPESSPPPPAVPIPIAVLILSGLGLLGIGSKALRDQRRVVR